MALITNYLPGGVKTLGELRKEDKMEITAIGATAQGVNEKALLQKGLEQAFLEEMLKYAGPSALQGSFGGGHGEEQFSSFMIREYAAGLSDRLDLGLDIPS